MNYTSTRNSNNVSASYAILNGLADDGGLYVPDEIPKINLASFENKSYQEIAFIILKLFFDEFSDEEIKNAIDEAYNLDNYDSLNINEVKVFQKYGYLELFHGNTSAFKDLALSIFPYLLLLAKKYQKDKNKVYILSATSGDTGKAAMEAVKDIKDIYITIMYPKDGVSDIQEAQMQKQSGDNIDVIAINGNFDDAQTLVKDLFLDIEFKKYLHDNDFTLTSANSINIARLIPQIIYYFDAYFKLVNSNTIFNNQQIDISIPTGNFGNILAAFIAKKMGLPIDIIMCASNENNILTEFINTGIYDTNRNLVKTYSPSMDIIISSNLERFLYFVLDNDYLKIKKIFESKYFVLDNFEIKKIKNEIIAYYTSNNECLKTIFHEYKEINYLIDPHTAIARYKALQHNNNFILIAATASPFKFSDTVLHAFNYNELSNPIQQLHDLTKIQIPKNIYLLNTLPIKFNKTIDVNDVRKYLFKYIGGLNNE